MFLTLVFGLLVFRCWPVTGFVDRLEGPTAVILSDRDDTPRDVPRRCLPPSAREGTFLRLGRIDGRATRRSVREARELLDPWNITRRESASGP